MYVPDSIYTLNQSSRNLKKKNRSSFHHKFQIGLQSKYLFFVVGLMAIIFILSPNILVKSNEQILMKPNIYCTL